MTESLKLLSQSNMWSLQILEPIRNEGLEKNAQWDYAALRKRAENLQSRESNFPSVELKLNQICLGGHCNAQ